MQLSGAPNLYHSGFSDQNTGRKSVRPVIERIFDWKERLIELMQYRDVDIWSIFGKYLASSCSAV